MYDSKDLFETYCGWGAAASLKKLQAYAKDKYGQSTKMGAWYAMWKYPLENPEEAYQIYKEYYFHRFPEQHQITEREFYEKTLHFAVKYYNIGGSVYNIRDFALKTGLEFEFPYRHGDVIWVSSHQHPLYQAILSVEKVEGENVYSYLINSDGTLTAHVLSIKDIAPINKRVQAQITDRQVSNPLTKIPGLRRLAKKNKIILKGIKFSKHDETVWFAYDTKEDGEVIHPHEDFDVGVDREIEWIKNK